MLAVERVRELHLTTFKILLPINEERVHSSGKEVPEIKSVVIV
jgi:hypothetical protein